MKIKYLGTAAYEGIPSLFCQCRVCKMSRKLGGKNMRSRSQALIDDELLIEFNADTVWHYQNYGFDWEKICGILITHSHCDHLYTDDIEMAAKGYTHEHRQLQFYSAQNGYEKIKNVADKIGGGASVHLVGKDRFTVGNYSVLPLKADHDPNSSPLIYSITKGDKRILYAHDTGYFLESVWEQLKTERHFDLVSLDCTGCLGLNGQWRNNHMTFGTNLEIVNRMRREGLIDENTKVVLNHFSHNGGQTHDEMCKATEKYDVIVAYDGLEIEF